MTLLSAVTQQQQQARTLYDTVYQYHIQWWLREWNLPVRIHSPLLRTSVAWAMEEEQINVAAIATRTTLRDIICTSVYEKDRFVMGTVNMATFGSFWARMYLSTQTSSSQLPTPAASTSDAQLFFPTSYGSIMQASFLEFPNNQFSHSAVSFVRLNIVNDDRLTTEHTHNDCMHVIVQYAHGRHSHQYTPSTVKYWLNAADGWTDGGLAGGWAC